VDALILAALALPLLWSRLQSGQVAVRQAYATVQQRLFELLEQSSGTIADPMGQALAWSTDPGLRAAFDALAAPLTSLCLHVTLVLFALAAIYFIASESSHWQASAGKRLLGLRVTDLGGQRPATARIILRFMAGILSWLLLNFGHALAAWTPDKRALHDYLAGTRVELAPGASMTLPTWARSWLWLQAVVLLGLLAYALLRYLWLLTEIAGSGLP